jgi:hypothetical protein
MIKKISSVKPVTSIGIHHIPERSVVTKLESHKAPLFDSVPPIEPSENKPTLNVVTIEPSPVEPCYQIPAALKTLKTSVESVGAKVTELVARLERGGVCLKFDVTSQITRSTDGLVNIARTVTECNNILDTVIMQLDKLESNIQV